MTAPRGGGNRAAYLAWCTICVVWGTTYLAIKIALEGMPPFLIGGVRYVVAGTLLAAWLVARREVFPPRRMWPGLIRTSFLMLALGNGGVVVAEQWVPSGVAAVVIATTPFWMVGVDALFPNGESLTRRQWAGLTVGFGGILLLVWPDLARGGASGWRFGAGVIALQVACAGWSFASSISKRMSLHITPVQTATLQMFFGGAWMVLIGTVLGEWRDVQFTMRSSAAVLYLAIVGGIGGFGAYIYALSRLPVAFVSLYAYVNPVIAMALGALLLAEPFTVRMAVAVGVVLAGMALVTTRRKPVATGTSGGDPDSQSTPLAEVS